MVLRPALEAIPAVDPIIDDPMLLLVPNPPAHQCGVKLILRAPPADGSVTPQLVRGDEDMLHHHLGDFIPGQRLRVGLAGGLYHRLLDEIEKRPVTIVTVGEEELLFGHRGNEGSIIDAGKHGAAANFGTDAASVRLPAGWGRPLAKHAFCVRVERATVIVVVRVGWWNRIWAHVTVGVGSSACGARGPVIVVVPWLVLDFFIVRFGGRCGADGNLIGRPRQ